MRTEPLAGVTARFPARPESLVELHAVFDRFFAEADGAGACIAAQDRMAFLTAAAEIASNILDHACHDRPDAEVCLALARCQDSMEARFEDQGTAYGEVVADPDNPVPHMGLGLLVARACLDHLDYERTGDVNRWTLMKTLGPETVRGR